MKRILFIFLLCTIFSASQAQIIRANSFARAVVSGAEYQNILLYSEDLTHATWVHDAQIAHTADQANDLEGNATMELLTATSADYNSFRQAFTAENDTEYEVSFDVIRGTFATAICQVYEEGGDYQTLLTWDYYGSTSASVTRISNTFTSNATTSLVIKIWITGSGNGTIYIGRAQIRATSSPDGYVKTEGAVEP